MGIRFFCPNGHRLHVKAFLAGKKGRCPECGERLLIPETSDPAAKRRSSKAKTAAAGGGGQVVDDEVSQLVEYADETQSQSTSAAHDPLAAAGEASWFVQHASGTQYGPAAGRMMRRWLNEGRISPDSMVWRQGWSEWRIASAVFIELAGQQPSPPPPPPAPRQPAGPRNDVRPPTPPAVDEELVENDYESAAAILDSDAPRSEAAKAAAELAAWRRRKQQRSLTSLVALVFAVIALAAALAVFALRSG